MVDILCLETHSNILFLCCAVLGRFLWALNEFCREEYGMDHSISEFSVYEFAKVPSQGASAVMQSFLLSAHSCVQSSPLPAHVLPLRYGSVTKTSPTTSCTSSSSPSTSKMVSLSFQVWFDDLTDYTHTLG